MLYLLKSDLYRLRKNKMFYCIATFVIIIGFLLTILNRQNIRLGISVFNNLITFISIKDIIKIGVQYQKGLGILVAIFISVFIGQEYQWSTWQHKWIISKSRVSIYMSKVILSICVSIYIFLLFETVVLLCSGQIRNVLTREYIETLICGSYIYMSLGAVICFISMKINNNTLAVIVSICYVLFSETLANITHQIDVISETISNFTSWCLQHSIYGMSSIICTTPVIGDFTLTIALNSIIISVIVTLFGVFAFRRYEL